MLALDRIANLILTLALTLAQKTNPSPVPDHIHGNKPDKMSDLISDLTLIST